MMETISKRLKAARKAAGFKSIEAVIERHPSWGIDAYKSHEAGRRNPKKETARTYAKAFKVRFEWLFLGLGEMQDIKYPSGGTRGAGGLSDIGVWPGDVGIEAEDAGPGPNASVDELLKLYYRSTQEAKRGFLAAINATVHGDGNGRQPQKKAHVDA